MDSLDEETFPSGRHFPRGTSSLLGLRGVVRKGFRHPGPVPHSGRLRIGDDIVVGIIIVVTILITRLNERDCKNKGDHFEINF